MLYYLLIEFLDEFIFGVREAAWPQIRNDLQLTYSQVGALLAVPGIASSLLEPILGIISDQGKRRSLILWGGVLYTLSLLMAGVSHSYIPLLLSFVIFYPSSGAFVSLSQTAVMDQEPELHEKNMAKWVFFGSLGVVIGPLFLSIVLMQGGNWRIPFIFTACLSIILVLWKVTISKDQKTRVTGYNLAASIQRIIAALKDSNVLRWLTLLAFSDLMLDILLGYLTLYLVEEAAVTQYQANYAVVVWAIVGLLGNFLLIHLLDRMPGLIYLKRSAMINLILYPLFLLIQAFGIKLLLLAFLGLFNAGWYSILKAQLYSALPDSSGIVLAVSNLFGLVVSVLPLGVGLIADNYGLRTAMWFLLSGPIVLVLGLPTSRTFHQNLVS